jgi:hypothetical protein
MERWRRGAVPGVSSRSLSGRVSKVKCVRVGTLSRRRVCESLLCPSACLCDGALQLKRGPLRSRREDQVQV